MNTKRFFIIIGAIAFVVINCNPVFSNSVYRFFNTTTGTHFYSSSIEETNFVLNTLPQFNYEGIAFSGASSTAVDVSPVYRFYNKATGTHFYTISNTEKDYIQSSLPNFIFEGEAYSAHTTKSSGTTALHRFYNTKTGTHFYTASDTEKTNVQNTLPEYNYEGIAYYVETPSCTLSISPTSSNFTSSGGTGIISITASTSSCAWTASENLSWVSLSSTSGTGTASISVMVTANTGAARTGSVTIAGKPYTISQAAITSSSACGAYVAPGVWKEFDCYNLAAIGKVTGADPFSPSWELNGGYWQWGRKGPDPDQEDWYNTNTPNFAHGPTGPGLSEANEGEIIGWKTTSMAPNYSWSDFIKTINDPCPEGFRVPTINQWYGVLDNNDQRTVGTWSSSPTNYSSVRFFGDDLMLPAAGAIHANSGALNNRGYAGLYWSGSVSDSINSAWAMSFMNSHANTFDYNFRRVGSSVRCVAE